jgi:ABC-2 type transport system permease protein
MKGLLAVARNAFAEAVARRAALVAQLSVMIANDVAWIVFWVLFFRRAGTVRGWDGDKILVLLSVMTGAAGIALGLLSNARRIGVLAVEGQLDSVLTLPVRPLPYLLLRRVEPTNLGDGVFGVTLFLVACHPTPQRLVTYVAVVLVSSVLLTSFLVLTGSSAFFAGRNEGAELSFHAVLLLGSYPVDVFAGGIKIFLYTVIPSAFVASVPATLIDEWSWRPALGLVTAAAVFGLAAAITFRTGLRRYTSGALWTQA